MCCLRGRSSSRRAATPSDPVTLDSRLASRRTVKLPCCAYHLAWFRYKYFAPVALVAAVCALALCGVKYWLAVTSEREAARSALRNAAKSLTKAMKLKMENDLFTLDSVANLWHLDSRMSRESFRKYVLSNYFKDSLPGIEIIMLTHRLQPHQRASLESDPAAVRVRHDCCSGTRYDVPVRGSICRARAKAQCMIPGPGRFYFTQIEVRPDGRWRMHHASHNSSEYLIAAYLEPLERFPGPLGFDMNSCNTNRPAFLESDRTGMKAVSKRVLRIFSEAPEFGLFVWNNVFVDRNTYGGKTILEGVQIATKQSIVAAGGDPYSIGAVVAIYKVQELLQTVVQSVFDDNLRYTKIFLLDDRASTEADERLLALYDSDGSRTAAAFKREVMAKQGMTLAELIASPDYEANAFDVRGSQARFRVVVVPYKEFFSTRGTNRPVFILMISLVLVTAAQMERWLGHPRILSDAWLNRVKEETEIRERLEARIPARARALASMHEESGSEFFPVVQEGAVAA